MASYALLIGINEYQYPEIPRLHGCVNDIELAAQMLQDRFGFDPDDIRPLQNSKATRDAILAQFDALTKNVRAGDKVVIYYSGHGSRVKDREGDEPDGFDDTIVPHDSGRENHPNRDITDDEIYVFLRRLTDKTQHCTLIFDSCHSGGISRDTFGAAARSVEPDLRTPAQHQAAGSAERPLPPDLIAEIKTARSAARSVENSGWLPLYEKYVLIAGCRSDQRSYEYPVDTSSGMERQAFTRRPVHGALSYFLWKTVSETAGRLSYRRLFEKLTPLVTAVYASQNPQIEGAVQTELFGTEQIKQRNDYLLVTASDDLSASLSAGAAQGVTVGSEYGVYAGGTTEITPETQKLGRLKVTEVSAITARAEILEGSAIAAGCLPLKKRMLTARCV